MRLFGGIFSGADARITHNKDDVSLPGSFILPLPHSPLNGQSRVEESRISLRSQAVHVDPGFVAVMMHREQLEGATIAQTTAKTTHTRLNVFYRLQCALIYSQ